MTDPNEVVIRINTVGASHEVEADPTQPLSEALADAGVDVDVAGLSVRVNGEDVDPEERNPSSGDQVTATPRNVKLGS